MVDTTAELPTRAHGGTVTKRKAWALALTVVGLGLSAWLGGGWLWRMFLAMHGRGH